MIFIQLDVANDNPVEIPIEKIHALQPRWVFDSRVQEKISGTIVHAGGTAWHVKGSIETIKQKIAEAEKAHDEQA